MEPTVGPTLGDFRSVEDSSTTAGTFEVDDGRLTLELLGCLEADRLPPDTQAVGYPRRLPKEGRHGVVTGLLRHGEPLTLIGVSGHAWGSGGIYNGRSWFGVGGPFAGGPVTMHAQHAVMRTHEAAEPTFDRVTFNLPELDNLLERTLTWSPTEQVDSVMGYVPVVIVPVEDYDFDLGEYQLGFHQVVSRSGASELDNVTSTMFSIRHRERQIRFTECVDILRDLRLLAEFSCFRHVGLGRINGRRRNADFDEDYPIHSWLQRHAPNRDAPVQQLCLSDLVPVDTSQQLDELSEEINVADADRAALIVRWRDWLAVEGNREAILGFLRPLCASPTPKDPEIFRSTVGVLEAMCGAPAERPRVDPVPAGEVEARKAAADTAGAALAEGKNEGVARWAIGRLKSGVKQKGLARRLEELLDQHAGALQCTLRASRSSHDREDQEAPKQTAQQLASTRGRLSHGSTGPLDDLSWRVDQLQLIFLGIVLSELGYDHAVVESITHTKSHNERWWGSDW